MKIILFDFDGVLVHTHIMCYEIHKELNPDLKYDFFQSLSHGNFWELYENAVKDKKIKHNSDFQNIYDERLSDLGMPKELKEIVLKLSKKYTLLIISSTHSNQIRALLEKESIADKFKMILGCDIHTSKTEKIKKVLNDYKILPKDVIFITDTTGDIVEARECGVESIAVTWGLHDKDYLSKENPLVLVNTPEELEQKIEEFFK
ncbi:HAD hydrolase-like protein [Candidatus Nomurabacteria bacterium]|nr:HAD hydrolase-like protein [Candidatus Nomurabacteria bacterium]